MKTASATEQLQTSNLLVKLPSGKTERLEIMYDESTLCKVLFDEIESLTVIPIGVQMISCGSRMMHPSGNPWPMHPGQCPKPKGDVLKSRKKP